MMTSLFDVPLMLFIFAPLLLTIALVCWIIWLKTRSVDQRDTAEAILAAAIQHMSSERVEWGKAMLAELEHFQGALARFLFALGCARVALFSPATTAWPNTFWAASKGVGINCGMLSVVLPPLALPFLYFFAVLADAFIHMPGQSTSYVIPSWTISACLIFGISLLLSGLPLGLAGWYRRERFLWLSALGPCLSAAICGYLWIFLYLFAVGPNGD